MKMRWIALVEVGPRIWAVWTLTLLIFPFLYWPIREIEGTFGLAFFYKCQFSRLALYRYFLILSGSLVIVFSLVHEKIEKPRESL